MTTNGRSQDFTLASISSRINKIYKKVMVQLFCMNFEDLKWYKVNILAHSHNTTQQASGLLMGILLHLPPVKFASLQENQPRSSDLTKTFAISPGFHLSFGKLWRTFV